MRGKKGSIFLRVDLVNVNSCVVAYLSLSHESCTMMSMSTGSNFTMDQGAHTRLSEYFSKTCFVVSDSSRTKASRLCSEFQ